MSKCENLCAPMRVAGPSAYWDLIRATKEALWQAYESGNLYEFNVELSRIVFEKNSNLVKELSNLKREVAELEAKLRALRTQQRDW